jgi:hypothetical protein
MLMHCKIRGQGGNLTEVNMGSSTVVASWNAWVIHIVALLYIQKTANKENE